MISHLFLWWHRSGVADKEVKQRHWNDESRRWCDGERRRNTDVQTNDRLQIRKGRRVDNRIDIWLTQISWTVSLIYKWIILYFISLKFYCFKNQFKLVYWKYSKTKIGHNFLPGLVRHDLNADLSLSVLRKKVISKIKIVNSDAFLIY